MNPVEQKLVDKAVEKIEKRADRVIARDGLFCLLRLRIMLRKLRIILYGKKCCNCNR